MPWGKDRFGRMKVPEKLPAVVRREEAERLFRYIGSLKHRAVLMLCYGAGRRIPEADWPKAAPIDPAQKLQPLRHCGKAQRPAEYLFPCIAAGTHRSASVVPEVCREARPMAGIEKRVTPGLAFAADPRTHVRFLTDGR
jgi:hypothetical protein